MWPFSMTQCVLLTLVLAVSGTKVHHIIPSPIIQCPMGESCLTLSMLAANISNYLDSNTTLIFLEGNYILDSKLSVSNIGEFLSLTTTGSVPARITCNGNVNSSLQFNNITQMQISGLEFIGCSSQVEFVDQFTLEDSSFFGENGDGSALVLTQTNTSIVRSAFAFNTVGTYRSHVRFFEYLGSFLQYRPLNIHSDSARVGGALSITSSNIVISSSHFDSNTAELGGAIFSELGSNITISNCTFVSNSVTGCGDDRCNGGALFIDSGCTVTAHNSTQDFLVTKSPSFNWGSCSRPNTCAM